MTQLIAVVLIIIWGYTSASYFKEHETIKSSPVDYVGAALVGAAITLVVAAMLGLLTLLMAAALDQL